MYLDEEGSSGWGTSAKERGLGKVDLGIERWRRFIASAGKRVELERTCGN